MSTKFGDYLESHSCSLNRFAREVGISSYCAIRIKRGLPVTEKTAQKVLLHTDGQISLPIRNVGRPIGTSKREKIGPFYREIWQVWYRMMNSCYNPGYVLFKSHGAKSHTVCEDWKKFECFYQDMAPLRVKGQMGIYLFPQFKEFSKLTCVWVKDGRNARKEPPKWEDPNQMTFYAIALP